MGRRFDACFVGSTVFILCTGSKPLDWFDLPGLAIVSSTESKSARQVSVYIVEQP
jgi:hypothetical protein